MLEEFEHCRIKKTGITGIIVDIATIKGKKIYTVEGDNKVPCENGEEWPLIQCTEDEIEEVKPV